MRLDKLTTVGAVCLTFGALCPPGAAQEPAKKPDEKTAARLEKLWADLASADEARAVRATLGLAANPKESLPFLADRLRPVKVDAASVAKLIKQLDSDDFDTREAAGRELEYLGKFAKAVLEKHLTEDTSPEAKRAIRVLIEKMPGDEKAAPPPSPKIRGRSVSIQSGNGEIQIIIDGKPLDLSAYAPRLPPPPPTGWARAVRAAAVLEHLGTPDARQLLEKLAGGEADAPPTKAAKEALERMKNKSD
jgi:hypothetical protein